MNADRKLGAQRLVALFVAGWLLLNFPLLGLFDGAASVFGVPVLLLALLVLWAMLIAVAAWLVEGRDPGEGEDGT